MPGNTRQKIMGAAMELFSQRGFEAVSVRDIAGAVGLRESSLYNHFRNKREIFDAIVDFSWKQAESYYREKNIPFTGTEDLTCFSERDFSRLSATILDTFRFFFADPWNVRFRRLLILSQFTDQRSAQIYRRLYRDIPLEIQEAVFAGLMAAGQFRQADPRAAALDFYGAVFLLLHTCESWEEAEPALLVHLRQFVDSYEIPAGKGEKP